MIFSLHFYFMLLARFHLASNMLLKFFRFRAHVQCLFVHSLLLILFFLIFVFAFLLYMPLKSRWPLCVVWSLFLLPQKGRAFFHHLPIFCEGLYIYQIFKCCEGVVWDFGMSLEGCTLLSTPALFFFFGLNLMFSMWRSQFYPTPTYFSLFQSHYETLVDVCFFV